MKLKLKQLFAFVLLIIFFFLPACKPENIDTSENDQQFLNNESNPLILFDEDEKSILAETLQHNVRFEHKTIEDGLSSNIVNDILQDRFGFIWIATFDGLNRFDGRNFKIYRNMVEDSNSLSDNTVWVLFEDSQGILWIGTENGLNKYDQASDSFQCYQHNPFVEITLSHNSVRVIAEDAENNIWVGTDGGGLNKLILDNDSFEHYLHQNEDPYSIVNNYVYDILNDERGFLWVGTGNGLDRFDPESGRFFHYQEKTDAGLTEFGLGTWKGIKRFDLESGYFLDGQEVAGLPQGIIANQISSIAEAADGRLWLGTLEGELLIFDPLDGTYKRFQPDSTEGSVSDPNDIYNVMIDRYGLIWVAADNGLEILNDVHESIVHFDSLGSESLSSFNLGFRGVNVIFQDDSDAYWIGTAGNGVAIFSLYTNLFQTILISSASQSSSLENVVWSFLEDSNGTLWIGTSQGVFRYDPRSKNFSEFDPHPNADEAELSDEVFSIIRDETGMLWVGTGNGLSRFNYKEQQFTTYKAGYGFSEETGLNPNDLFITDIFIDSDGFFWLATYGSGLVKLNPNNNFMQSFLFKSEDDTSISSNVINKIFQDKDGVIWIGTLGGGLNRYDTQNNRFFRYTNSVENTRSISSNDVAAIHQDRDGNLWVATLAGLNRYSYETNDFERFTSAVGLPNDAIYGILEDEHGNLWLSTNNGIVHYDPENLTSHFYTHLDGLQSGKFNNGSYHHGVSGAMYFGGMNGFNKFIPEQIAKNPFEPSVVLLSVTQSGEQLEVNTSPEILNEIVLRWPNNYFEFEFAALNYIQSQKNQYAYILENFDRKWNYVGNQSYGRYTNLPTGEFTLKIIGSNNDGVWNNQGVSIKVKVLPVWWQTSWLRILAVVLVASAAAGLYRIRLGNVKKYSLDLEKQVFERTEDIEKRRKVAEGLREILIRLNSDQAVEESVDFIACQANRLLASEQVVVFEIKNEFRTKILAVSPQEPCGDVQSRIDKQPAIIVSDALLTHMSKRLKKEPYIVINNLAEYSKGKPELKAIISANPKFIVAAPVYLSERVYGGMLVQKKIGEGFSAEDLELLRSFADQVALAIGNNQLRQHAEEMAVISERNRIARDLHDAITQTLFSANLMAETLPEIWERDWKKALQVVAEMRQLNRSALSEMRTLLLELRPKAVVESKMSDLLRQLADVLQGQSGMKVHLNLQDECNLPEEVHITLYRIAQEILANVLKHSRARQVWVHLKCQGQKDGTTQKTYLKIRDNGIGFDASTPVLDRFGLRNVQERALDIGATITIESQEKKGTTIIFEWQGE